LNAAGSSGPSMCQPSIDTMGAPLKIEMG
jgi:hypothetical protein